MLFRSNLAGRCQPFNRLMKKDVHFEWDEAYSNAFARIKRCLHNPPVLGALIPGKPLVLYIAAQIFGDSKLVINQILEQFDVKKEDLIPYCKYAKKLLANFEAITLDHIPRKENGQADALTNLATVLALSQEEITKVAISQRWVVPLVIKEEEKE